MVFSDRVVILSLSSGLFIHAFTCAGILPSQYGHFCQFAGVGEVGKWYIKQGTLMHMHMYNQTME